MRSAAYSTWLEVWADQVSQHKRLTGRGWSISFRLPPVKERTNYTNDQADREVILDAPSEPAAIRALDLIHAGLLLLQPDMETAYFDLRLQPLAGPDRHLPRHGYSSQLVLPACEMACKASRSKRLTYAMLKFFLSTRLFCRHDMDLSPGHIPGGAVSRYPLDHVHFAYAIVVAYAVIEELGLEVRVPRGSYSVQHGIWNPTVRQDLEHRLTRAGVDISETIVWMARSTPTRVERRNSTPAGPKSSWSCGSTRDKDTNVIDAINHCSRLRSRVAAHRFSEPTPSLSQFDVGNVQFVARRLLLETLGFWNPHKRRTSNRATGTMPFISPTAADPVR